jgi:hypothetical protein
MADDAPTPGPNEFSAEEELAMRAGRAQSNTATAAPAPQWRRAPTPQRTLTPKGRALQPIEE